MSLKFKIFGLGVFAFTAMSSIAAMNATAETGGHFTAEGAGTKTIVGSENSTHHSTLGVKGLTPIECTTTSYDGSVTASIVTEITITPSYANCHTESHVSPAITVKMNGCDYVFTIGKKSTGENTVDLKCPEGKQPEIEHEGCLIKFPAQNNLVGVTYNTTVENGKHAITLGINVTGITAHFETGFCFLLGTKQSGTLSGSVTVVGENASKEKVGITAIGSEEPLVSFNSEIEDSRVTGVQTSVNSYRFGELIGNVECTIATFDGTIAGKSGTELTIKPSYAECLGLKKVVTAHMNGCAYILTLTGEKGTDGGVDIECPAGASIETTVDKFPGGCTLTIGAQSASGVVDYKGEGSGSTRELLLTWTLEGLKYKRDGCEIGGEGNNGTMTGTVTLEGEDISGNRKGLWIE